MPKALFGADHAFLDRKDLLTFEEITRVARLFSELGVEKLRLTGGEPLVRRDLERLVGALARLPAIRDMSLTTNGALLTRARARALGDAGLRRITVSLDALDDAVFARINDVAFPVARVLEAVEHAHAVGLRPVKVNMVVKRGMNDDQILPMAEYFRGTPHILRFIEFMDVGTTNGWRLDDVVSAQEILSRIDRYYPLEVVTPNYPGEVANRWRYRDGAGEIGIISSVTRPFCGGCTRARLSAEGTLFTCLFAHRGRDLRAALRTGSSDREILGLLGRIWSAREDRYSEIRSARTEGLEEARTPRIEMSYIGG